MADAIIYLSGLFVFAAGFCGGMAYRKHETDFLAAELEKSERSNHELFKCCRR